MSSASLPETHRALVCHSLSQPLRVETLPTPQPGSGSVIVHPLASTIISYSGAIYNGSRPSPYPFPLPLITGASAIGRIAAIGPDATTVEVGQLVFVDPLVRARDDYTNAFLSAVHEGFTEGSKKLMAGPWRESGTYAEYCRVPLENVTPLNEARLVKELDLEPARLAFMAACLVPYGGFRDIDLRPGETVIVAPATGAFGGAAVMVALAVGAKVVAMGRDEEKLNSIKEKFKKTGRIETVPITGDVMDDLKALQAFGVIDAYLDISPPEAAKSTHLKSCILSLRHGGRVSLMGGLYADIPIPHAAVMHRNLKLQGKWMCEREDIASLTKMIEAGLLDFGEASAVNVIGKFALSEWERAFEVAKENAGLGQIAVFCP